MSNRKTTMSSLHKTDVNHSSNEAPNSRNLDLASNDFRQLIVLPFICSGIAVAGELEKINNSIDGRQFWQGYRIMSGRIFVLLVDCRRRNGIADVNGESHG